MNYSIHLLQAVLHFYCFQYELYRNFHLTLEYKFEPEYLYMKKYILLFLYNNLHLFYKYRFDIEKKYILYFYRNYCHLCCKLFI